MKEAGGGSWRTEAFSMACVLATFRDEGAVGDLSKLMLLKDNFQWYQQLVPTFGIFFFEPWSMEQGYDA